MSPWRSSRRTRRGESIGSSQKDAATPGRPFEPRVPSARVAARRARRRRSSRRGGKTVSSVVYADASALMKLIVREAREPCSRRSDSRGSRRRYERRVDRRDHPRRFASPASPRRPRSTISRTSSTAWRSSTPTSRSRELPPGSPQRASARSMRSTSRPHRGRSRRDARLRPEACRGRSCGRARSRRTRRRPPLTATNTLPG